MKILLVFPTATIYKSDPTVPGANIPLGLAYIAGYLEENGYQVEILDALASGIDNIVKDREKTRVGLSKEEIYAYISQRKPDIVGISSIFTAYARDAHDVARIVKKVNPNAFVVFGGAHASANPEMVLRDKNVDVIVVGEGEITFLELVKTLEEGGEVGRILGTVTRFGDKIRRNGQRPYIENLDMLPLPARHLFPMDIYIREAKSPYLMRTPLAQMITSRGCPQNCIFCSIHSVWGHKWRARGAKGVVDEIEFLIREYGVREISFLDDSIATSKKRMEAICDEIIKRGLDIVWTVPNGIAHWTLDKALVKKMKKSGCYRLTFGIESGNVDTRRFIRKTHDLSQATEIIRYSNKIGLWTICTFIIGFPFETVESINDTIKYAIKSDTDYALFYLSLPFPGTELYDIYKQEGLLDLDGILYSQNPTAKELAKLGASLAHGGCDTKYFTKEQLQDLLASAYRIFWSHRFKSFLNPMRALRKIRSLEGLLYVIKLMKIGIQLKAREIRHKKFIPQMVYKDYDKC
ncbi:MAG: B12-binding domain-containing radical SAM protein [Actinobacteria bacterium]|nr:B12-binding domain-containing radical SAM protein [Actinomycetota bacterium]